MIFALKGRRYLASEWLLATTPCEERKMLLRDAIEGWVRSKQTGTGTLWSVIFLLDHIILYIRIA